MACEVKISGKIKDFRKVQEYFGLTHDDNWFNSINYAISPTGETIALGQGEKLALLSSHWDNREQSAYYALSWCGELEVGGTQILTSLICLPMFGKTVSSGSEWTCVGVGFSSGMVAFYTDTGHKIFSQICHDEPVLSLKSYSPPRHSEADAFLYIVYDRCVCIVRGADIFPLLTSLRHNLQRTLVRNVSHTRPEDTADTLQYQKFKFKHDQSTIVNDAIVAGCLRPCSYDYIVEQSLSSGLFGRVSGNPPQSSRVVAVGAEPFISFNYAEEGYKTISLGEVAKDVIGAAYKNLLGGLFSRPEPVKPADPPSPSKELPMRNQCRLYDGKRDGYTIAVAPNGRLAAVTDNLDRVMLVDSQRAVVLRVWKGYRDAQCAFVPVKEKVLRQSHQQHRRRALFLVIYAPRLGLLEIWALQNGPKVAAFTVSKSGQLAYNTHGLMGIQPGAKVKATTNCCYFLDPSDASIKEIVVPFHYALSETNSKTSKDIHLMRKLKSLLRNQANSEISEEAVRELALEFQTVEVRQQTLEMLLKNKQLKPELFKIIVDSFLEVMAAAGEAPVTDELKSLQTLCENYKHLVDFYIAMRSPEETEFDEHLELCDADLVVINKLLLLLGYCANESSTKEDLPPPALGRVTFQEKCEDEGDFADFLSIFQTERSDCLPLRADKAKIFGYVSGHLFGEFFDRGLAFEKFKVDATKTNIPHEDLLVLALSYWLEKPFEYQICEEIIADMSRLAVMVRTICELAGDQVNDYAYNAVSPWWQKVREMLLDSPRSLGLLVAIVCKTVATNLRKSYREGSCDEISLNEESEKWEQISHDEAQWVLLISKLEDISVLGAILECPLESSSAVMPKVPYVTPDCSLKAIVNGGKGIVADLTAQWLINSRIHPAQILEPVEEAAEVKEDSTGDTKEKPQVTQEGGASANEEAEGSEVNDQTPTRQLKDPVLEKLKELREHFPFSLESGVLLSLMTWHYMVHWSKNLQSLEHMRAALTCLGEFKPEDLALKHGICCLIWNATLKYPLQSTMKLIQKVGRLPVDKMCQQDLEMTAGCVPEFVELCGDFLQHFASSLDHKQRELKFEESLADGQLPLQFLALQQHNAIEDLLRLQSELCTVLHFITYLQLKVAKPITTVFDAMTNKAFVADINKELTFVLPAPDLALQQERENFLCKVITASMDLIREDLSALYVDEHRYIMDRVYKLAESWKLETHALKRKQIVEMYAHSFDNEAEQLLKDFIYDEEMGRMLLEIAGRRLNLYASSSRTAYLKIASIGPQLLDYIDNLEPAEASNSPSNTIEISACEPEEINVSGISKLLSVTLKCPLKRDSKYVHIAVQMYDACCVLQE